MIRSAFTAITFALALVLMAFGVREGVMQHREGLLIRSATEEALSAAHGTDFDSKVTAMRDYVRTRVQGDAFSSRNRPFFRDSAAETLQSGKGRCGEATRLFVNMAAEAGISAHRLYLEGKRPHVVAVVIAEDGSKQIVDSAWLQFIPENVPLESLKQSAMFTSYATFGWRRLGVLRALPSNDVNLGPINYFLENPHALLALLGLFVSSILLSVTYLFGWKKLQHSRRRKRSSEVGIIAGVSGSAEV